MKLIILLIGILAIASPVQAQATQSTELEQQGDEKEQQLRQREPGLLQSIIQRVEKKLKSDAPDEGRPKAGPFVRPSAIRSGAGLGVRGGYRQPLFGNRAMGQVSAAVSMRGYRAADATLEIPIAGDRLVVSPSVAYRYFPREDFFGLGMHSKDADETSFLMEDVDYSVEALWRPAGGATVGARAGYLATRIGAGRDPRHPSTAERFAESEIPGLLRPRDYLHVAGFVEMDSRDAPDYARSGAFYRLEVSSFHDTSGGAHGFRQLEAEGQRFVSFGQGHRTVALRALMTLSGAAEGATIPLYMMPTLGGSSTLRGFDSFRFRDHHRVLVNAEYRFEATRYLDLALFADAGVVGRRVSQLVPGRMRTAYGVGLRFKNEEDLLFRVDVGAGGEGVQFIVSLKPPF